MKHLNDSEFVDLIDKRLDPARELHVLDCAQCQQEANALRDALTRTTESAVPEPSPLFWDHFSARVREAVEDSPAETTGWAGQPWWKMRWAAASSCALILVLVAALWRAMTPAVTSPSPRPATIAQNPVVAGEPETTGVDDPDTDEAWSLVRTVADDVSWDETLAVGLSARPGSVERAALALNAQERSELARLLRDEMKRPGA